MSTKSLLSVVGALALSMTALSAQALPFSFEYNDTVSVSTIAGVSVGNAVNVTVNLDNGGSSLLSQTWTAADLQSVVFDFGNGALHTTFTSPFGGGLTFSSGGFITNASGVLTSVLTSWGDNTVGANFTTNGSTPVGWFLDGSNNVYYNSVISSIGFTNVAAITTPAAWSPVAASSVPIPATAWLWLAGFAGFSRFSKRRAAA